MRLTRLVIPVVLNVIVSYGQNLWSNVGPPNPSSSFFFFCNYGRQDWTQLPGIESSVNVQLSGDPKHYVSGQIYKVSVTVSVEFDAFLVTGVYSTSRNLIPSIGLQNYVKGSNANGQLCTILHTTADRRPKKKVSFFWMAPPAEMGCLDFIATATLKSEIIFKDMNIYRICSETEGEGDSKQVSLAGLYGEGFIFRDDFESGDIDDTLWTKKSSVKVSADCEAVLHGFSASFCSFTNSTKLLTTVLLNTTSAGVLQFGMGRTSCSGTNTGITTGTTTTNDVNVTVHYGTVGTDNECENFTLLQTFSVAKGKEAFVNIVPLPSTARQGGVCFRWSAPDSMETCWALDDVIITNAANRPASLHVDFDPFNASDWLFFPGGTITRSCQGDGYALAFNASSRKTNWATTRDLLINIDTQPADILWKPQFNSSLQNQWELNNAQIKENCEGKLVLHIFNDDNFSACTPALNLTAAGNFRFKLTYSSYPNCSLNSATRRKETEPGKLNVWVESDKRYMIYSTLNLAKKGTVSVSSIIATAAQKGNSKICWRLYGIDPVDWGTTSWSVDEMLLLPIMPSNVSYSLQYRLVTSCNSKVATATQDEPFQIIAQYSNDQGRQWSTLNSLCLPPTCNGVHWALQSIVSSNEDKPWERFTFPLPYAALQGPLRIRFTQKNRGNDNAKWSIDDIHLANCPYGCYGRGFCDKGEICICDEGYDGPYCENSLNELPTTLRDDFESDTNENFYKITGYKLSNLCGPVGSGKGAVFNESGARQIVTIDMDTSDSEILSFVVLMADPLNDLCPGPDRSVEAIYVHYSCNGGVTWTLITTVLPERNNPVKLTSYRLPHSSRQPSCRFKLWQPYHSGKGKDVWILDDLYVGPHQAEYLQFNDTANQMPFLSQQFQTKDFCNRSNVVLPSTEVSGSSKNRKLVRNLEILPVRVGPYSVLQMEVVVSCRENKELNSSLWIEFSVDGGLTWNRLHSSSDKWEMHASQLRNWKRIAVQLPQQTWSQSTRFQLRQENFRTSEEILGLGYLYVGPKCPELCRNNGRCTIDGCICDEGFHKENCLPINVSHLGNTLNGGRLVANSKDGDACFVPSADNFYFDLPGVRFAESEEVKYSPDLSVSFILHLGPCENLQHSNETTEIQLSLSWDGGNEWLPVQEYRQPFYSVPTFVLTRIPQPDSSLAEATVKARLSQNGVQLLNHNVWGVAGFNLGSILVDNPVNESQEAKENLWMYPSVSGIASGVLKYHKAMTKQIVLQPTDAIEFKLVAENMVSEKEFLVTPLELDYSVDDGVTWNPYVTQNDDLVVVSKENDQQMFHVKPTEDMILKPILLRWQLQYLMGASPIRFHIEDLHIGEPCPSLCSGHGHCTTGLCTCHQGYSGSECVERNRSSTPSLIERFNSDSDNVCLDTDKWSFVIGGKVITDRCTSESIPNRLAFFSDNRHRIIQTGEINTQEVKLTEFTIGFTKTLLNKIPCIEILQDSPGIWLHSNVVLDFTVNNGLTWNRLKDINPEEGFRQKIQILLPENARHPLTQFRWSQKPSTNETNSTKDRLFWYLDDIVIGYNESSPSVFEFPAKDEGLNFSLNENQWFNSQGVSENLEKFSRDFLAFLPGSQSFVETWDLEVFHSTFVQFELMAKAKKVEESLPTDSMQLQFSKDFGKTWNLVQNGCFPLQRCSAYQLPSKYSAIDYQNKTTITLQVPEAAVSKNTRFRWILEDLKDSAVIGSEWFLGNVYVGNSCPWMCSGRGRCHNGFCICDEGFTGTYCVPAKQLPTSLTEDFEDESSLNQTLSKILGARISESCGVLVSGKAAVFNSDGLRLLETVDLDLTDGLYIQLVLSTNCEFLVPESRSRNKIILLQYSTNGGITWNLIQMIELDSSVSRQKISVEISQIAELKSNSSRLQLWQPRYSGVNRDTWAVDSLTVITTSQGLSPFLSVNFSSFHQDSASGLRWYGAQIADYCHSDERQALLLGGKRGENAVYTRDMSITSDMVLQFEIAVGCDPESVEKSFRTPVRLEYSTDGGLTWFLVNSPSFTGNIADLQNLDLPTEYYGFHGWRRVTIPLDNPAFSKVTRFRWLQNFLARDDPEVPKWGLSNIYLGSQCQDHCSGHGTCVPEELACLCDPGFDGERCEVVVDPTRNHLQQSFDSAEKNPDGLMIHGGSISSQCGENSFGNCVLFAMAGQRWIQTEDLNTTEAKFLQFYLGYNTKLDEDAMKNGSSINQGTLLVQYSIDGGLSWNLLEKILESNDGGNTIFMSIKLPVNSLSEATRFRWWQIGPQHNGQNQWTLDEIFLAGEGSTLSVLDEDFNSQMAIRQNFLQVKGASVEPSCNSDKNSLHFRKYDRKKFAVTKDIYVAYGTHIQFELSMNCMHNDYPNCSKLDLEYSTDYGMSWNSLSKACALESSGCKEFSSIYALSSDSVPLKRRITIPFPISDTVARFRWIQMEDYDPTFTWSLHWVYIGNQCGDCSGHGRCNQGTCHCDENFGDLSCTSPLNPLPQRMRENFHGSWNTLYWNRVSGATVSEICGKVGSGEALHFYGPCTRVAETVDLNLEQTVVVQFFLKSGCGKGKVSGIVLFQYSLNGGITWTTISTYALAEYKEERLVTQRLPIDSRFSAVRLRWWQPIFDGLMDSDWAIDSLIFDTVLRIDTSDSQSKQEDSYLSQSASDYEDSAELLVENEVKIQNFLELTNELLWWRRQNLNYTDNYCGNKFKNRSTVIGASTAQEDSILESIDASIDNLENIYLSFTLRLGDCGQSKEEDFRSFVSIEVSTDYGVSWQLLKVSRMRGQHLGPPQLPSIFTEPNTWIKAIYPLEDLPRTGVVRFRWIQKASPLKTFWMLKDIFVGFRKLLPKNPGQMRYAEDFNSGKVDQSLWDFVYGGRLMVPDPIIGDGYSAVFTGPRLRILQTEAIDMISAHSIEAILHIRTLCDPCTPVQSQAAHVYLECSTDEGGHWHLMNEYRSKEFAVPSNSYVPVPKKCRSRRTLLRWWQPFLIDPNDSSASHWVLDNIFIDRADPLLQQLYDNFNSSSGSSQWTFVLNGKVGGDDCSGRNNSVTRFSPSGSSKETAEQSLTSRRILVGHNYVVQFKIRVGCGQSVCGGSASEEIRFEYRSELTENRWTLVKPSCLPQNDDNPLCQPHIYDTQSTYDSSTHSTWTRINIRLKTTPYPLPWQFRFIKSHRQTGSSTSSVSWAVDDVYIGPSCPDLCHGNGDCVNGACRCDNGYRGPSCLPSIVTQGSSQSKRGPRVDNFDDFDDNPWTGERLWTQVDGGTPSKDCGSFVPHGHGRHLHFDGCARRMATTKFFETSKISRLSFALRTGSPAQQSIGSCRIQQQQQLFSNQTSPNRAILLQYTFNGIDWNLLATHNQQDFINARKVAYQVPVVGSKSVVQFRWWQPQHGGLGWDQWALDNVELQA